MRTSFLAFGLGLLVWPGTVAAAVFEVGPGQALASLGEVPWESLAPGDEVRIHWRETPYQEKFVLCRRGESGAPITVRGLRGPQGQRPVIDGRDATTRSTLNFWNEPRGVIKVGGANTPPDLLPAHITIEGLDIRSARAPYTFTGRDGLTAYATNAAAIFVEKAEHLTIRDCELSDSGNGLFVAPEDGQTQHILVEGNFIHGNGNPSSAFEHNSYTSAIDIVFQHNRYGPLCAGCDGNNLKDRSAGLVVRTNWIEGGNRQLDLVDAEDSQVLVQHPAYRTTFVYGNVLFEGTEDGNSQIVHYGGDSDTEADYRKGTLYFYHNTVVSRRPNNTTLLHLSTNEERAEVVNNALWVTADGDLLALLDGAGTAVLSHNFFKPGWVATHGDLTGTIDDDGTSVESASPGFVDEGADDFHLAGGSPCLDAGGALPAGAATYPVLEQYVAHQAGESRPTDGPPDLGAFERCATGCTTDGGDGGADAGEPDGGDSDAGADAAGDAGADAGSDPGGADGGDAGVPGDRDPGSLTGSCGCASGGTPPVDWLLGLWLILAIAAASRSAPPGRRVRCRPRCPPARPR